MSPGLPGKLFALVVLLLLAFSLPAHAAPTWREAMIEMTDGTAWQGQFSFTNDQFLMHNVAQKKRITIGGGEIAVFEVVAEQETMEKKWFFKEDGRDEKVYTGELFPVKYFLGRATYPDGRTLEGHIISQSLLLKEDGRARNIMLSRKMEGKVGETLDDLVTLRKITVLNPEAPGTAGEMRGTVRLPEGERLLHVLALHTTRDVIFTAKLDRGGRFRIAPCTAGAYDLVVVSDRCIYFRSALDGARWDEAALKEVADWAAQIREFFHEQTPLYGAGDTKRAYVLARMERHGGTSLRGSELVRRYEIWLMEKPVDEWRILKRFYLSRVNSKEKDVPRERIVPAKQLSGHAITPEKPVVEIEVDLNREDAEDAKNE